MPRITSVLALGAAPAVSIAVTANALGMQAELRGSAGLLPVLSGWCARSSSR